MSTIPQPGDVIATRVSDQGGVAGFHGAPLVARRDEPLQSEATDLSNVVPFARPRRQGAAAAFPLPCVTAGERPAPQGARSGIGSSIALVAASLALHSMLLAMFWQEPKPMASIGVEVMTVEITLGATTAAGIAPTPSEQEVQPVPPTEQPAQDEVVTEPSRATTVMPQEVPVAAQEAAPQVAQQETPPEAQTVEPTLQERPETATAEAPASTQPPQRTEQPRPQIRAVQKAPKRKRIAAPTDKQAAQNRDASRPQASKGVGRGRSANYANYNGMIAAHLGRYKQYPASARSSGAQGVAAVSFSIDGRGRVTSARLARGSGNSAIDQEVVAMARRASPFPPPPDGRGRNFTVPVRFNLR
ncbi:MAG: TonB family protein [Rhizobiales bacterium]|nr:TonB family protein [Hyphomicrobiales bacterium]